MSAAPAPPDDAPPGLGDPGSAIVAVASAPGPAGRAVIRLSGPGTADLLTRLALPPGERLQAIPPATWTTVRGVTTIRVLWSDGETDGRTPSPPTGDGGRGPDEGRSLADSSGTPLAPGPSPLGGEEGRTDTCPPRPGSTVEVAVQTFPGRGGYTGEPAAELHLPGSPPVVTGVVRRLVALGARPARPGEFTLRAFLSGRLDLAQAEAVRDVIDSDDPAALTAALDRLAGGLGRAVRAVRDDLLDLLADLEAGLDFVEEDLAFVTPEQAVARLEAARRDVAEAATRLAGRGLGTVRPAVVLAGRPNAGKSSLFNRLVGREAALVSPAAGTTRDTVAEEVAWGGVAVELIDTAGLAPGGPPVSASESGSVTEPIFATLERAAEERSRHTVAEAAVTLLLVEAGRAPGEDEMALWQSLPREGRLLVRTKADQERAEGWGARGEVGIGPGGPNVSVSALTPHPSPLTPAVAISSQTGVGLAELQALVAGLLERRQTSAGERASPAAHAALVEAGRTLAEAEDAARRRAGDELVAVNLRQALDELGRVVGATVTEDILDRLFARFCIGK